MCEGSRRSDDLSSSFLTERERKPAADFGDGAATPQEASSKPEAFDSSLFELPSRKSDFDDNESNKQIDHSALMADTSAITDADFSSNFLAPMQIHASNLYSERLPTDEVKHVTLHSQNVVVLESESMMDHSGLSGRSETDSAQFVKTGESDVTEHSAVDHTVDTESDTCVVRGNQRIALADGMGESKLIMRDEVEQKMSGTSVSSDEEFTLSMSEMDSDLDRREHVEYQVQEREKPEEQQLAGLEFPGSVGAAEVCGETLQTGNDTDHKEMDDVQAMSFVVCVEESSADRFEVQPVCSPMLSELASDVVVCDIAQQPLMQAEFNSETMTLQEELITDETEMGIGTSIAVAVDDKSFDVTEQPGIETHEKDTSLKSDAILQEDVVWSDTLAAAAEQRLETSVELEEFCETDSVNDPEVGLSVMWKDAAGGRSHDGESLRPAAKFSDSYVEQDSARHVMEEAETGDHLVEMTSSVLELERHLAESDGEDDAETVTSDEWCVMDRERDAGFDTELMEDFTAETYEQVSADIGDVDAFVYHDSTDETSEYHTKTYYHVDRATLDERLEASDRDSFGFQLINLPVKETGQPVEIAGTLESSMTCESSTDAEAGYAAERAVDEGRDSHTVVFDDWDFISIPLSAATSGRLQLEEVEPKAEYDVRAPTLCEDMGKDPLTISYEALSTSEDICLPSDIATVPIDTCELQTRLSDVHYGDDIYEDTSFSLASASDIMPISFFSDSSFLHTAGKQTLQTGETATISLAEEVTSSASISSPSVSSAAVEVCQSFDQQLYPSVCEPICAHPDVVYLEPSIDTDHPVVLEREQTHSDDLQEQRVPFGAQFPSQSTAEELRQPDGSIVRRRVIRTRVRRVATRHVRRRQPDGRVVEYTETVELPEEESDGSEDQLSELVGAASDVAGAAGQVVGVYTDTERSGEPQVDTDVEVFRETLPDGRVVERRVVRTRQRKTVVKRVVVRPDRS